MTVRRGAVAEPAVIVLAPADGRSARQHGARVITAGRDAGHAAREAAHVHGCEAPRRGAVAELAYVIGAPGICRAVLEHCHRVFRTRCQPCARASVAQSRFEDARLTTVLDRWNL